MRAEPLKRDLPVTLMLRWCFNNFLHTLQEEGDGGGWSAHTHTALVKPPCPSNRVQIQIITNQIFLWPFRGFRAKIDRCFKTPGIPKIHMGQAFVFICLFCESHINLEEILIVACQEGVLTLSEDLFYLRSSGTCLANTVVFFWLLPCILNFSSLSWLTL